MYLADRNNTLVTDRRKTVRKKKEEENTETKMSNKQLFCLFNIKGLLSHTKSILCSKHQSKPPPTTQIQPSHMA